MSINLDDWDDCFNEPVKNKPIIKKFRKDRDESKDWKKKDKFSKQYMKNKSKHKDTIKEN